MDFETLEPMSYETADGLIDFPDNGLVSLDFPNTAFDSMNYDMMKPTWTYPCMTDLNMLQFDNVDAGSMEFDVTNSGSTESGDINFSENTWAPTDSGVPKLDEMRFGSAESETTHTLMAASNTIDPVTIAGQSMSHDRIDVNRIDSNSADVTVTNYDLIGSCNLNPGTGGTDNPGSQHIQPSYQKRQTSAAGQCNDTNTGVYYLQHSQTPFPHLKSHKQPTLGIIPASKNMRPDNGKEYQPKSLDMLTTRAKITADDWEDHRAFIKQLYLVENVKLEDVMQIMEIRFGFVAR